MILYHVVGGMEGQTIDVFNAVPTARNFLLSYAYRSQEPWLEHPSLKPPLEDLLIDSGAFTVHSRGAVITPEEYAAWVKTIQRKWTGRVRQLRFISLDVIGDQVGTWKNYETLRKLDCPVMPVVTYGARVQDIRRAFREHPDVCFGGLVPYMNPARRKSLLWWLDTVFNVAMAFREESGRLPRIHLLGVATLQILSRYPAYSSDSSSWVVPQRWGHSKLRGVDRYPPHSYREKDPRIWAVRAAVMAEELRRLEQIVADATRVWTARGITFKEQPWPKKRRRASSARSM